MSVLSTSSRTRTFRPDFTRLEALAISLKNRPPTKGISPLSTSVTSAGTVGLS